MQTHYSQASSSLFFAFSTLQYQLAYFAYIELFNLHYFSKSERKAIYTCNNL